MKIEMMYCDCCGKSFYNEYWNGGYIDHVINFSDHFESYSKLENSVKRLSTEIIFHGGSVRDICDISARLLCMKNSKYFSDDVKTEVGQIVEEMMIKIICATNEAQRIEDSTTPLILAKLRRDNSDNAYWMTFDALLKENGVKLL